MSAEASTPPHRAGQHAEREYISPGRDPVSDDPVSDDSVRDITEQTEPAHETAGALELFGKPVVTMEPGQFRLPEVHRHIQAGRVVLLLPASPRAAAQAPPADDPPVGSPSTT